MAAAGKLARLGAVHLLNIAALQPDDSVATGVSVASQSYSSCRALTELESAGEYHWLSAPVEDR